MTTTSTAQMARPFAQRPGYVRLALCSNFLALGSAVALWSVLLAVLGFHALDFTLGFVGGAHYPEPFVLNGVGLPVGVAAVVLVPLAAATIAGRFRQMKGGPALALAASAGWVALDGILVVAGGDAFLLVIAMILCAFVASGVWAGRAEWSLSLFGPLPRS